MISVIVQGLKVALHDPSQMAPRSHICHEYLEVMDGRATDPAFVSPYRIRDCRILILVYRRARYRILVHGRTGELETSPEWQRILG